MPFPIDEKYIAETEKELGILFPGNFKSKMMKENGGELMTDNDDWNVSARPSTYFISGLYF